jgi:tetratricopeptide (TPR) repeat protein
MKLHLSGNIGIRVDNIQNIKIIKKNQAKMMTKLSASAAEFVPGIEAHKQRKNTKTTKTKINPEKWKDLGNKEFRQKNFEDAIAAYKRALATDNLELKIKVIHIFLIN